MQQGCYLKEEGGKNKKKDSLVQQTIATPYFCLMDPYAQ